MTAGRTAKSSSREWGTPLKYVEAVRAVLGEIQLDPCANQWSIVKAVVEYKLPSQDGLKEPWNFTTIYVNPPYGADQKRGTSIRDWLSRCATAATEGSEVIALCPVATNTRHWKDSVWPIASGICFLADTRLKFLEAGVESGKGAPMACAMVYWGKKFAKFESVFTAHGAVVQLKGKP